MKTTILKLCAFALLIALMGAGCEKEKNDYDPNSIVGKWKLIKVGSCVGKDNFISEITSDSIIKTYINGNLISTSLFRIRKGKVDDTIFYDNKKDFSTYAFIKLISADTLRVYSDISYLAPVCEYSSRIKE